MEHQIDARGLACPLPVMRASKLLGEIEKGRVIVVVDNSAAQNNIRRMAENLGCTVRVNQRGKDYYLTIIKG